LEQASQSDPGAGIATHLTVLAMTAFFRHCEKRSDEAISVRARNWHALRALAASYRMLALFSYYPWVIDDENSYVYTGEYRS
jgi:hypothetical protein